MPALPAPQRPRLLDARRPARCPSPSATSSRRWRSRRSTATTRSATSSCARWCSGSTPTSRRRRSSAGSTPTWPTTSATWCSRATTLIVNLGRGAVPEPRDADRGRGRGGARPSPRRGPTWRRAMDEFAFQPGAGGDLGVRRRREPLRRRDAAVGAGQGSGPAAAAGHRCSTRSAESLRCLGIVLDPFLPDGRRRRSATALGQTAEPEAWPTPSGAASPPARRCASSRGSSRACERPESVSARRDPRRRRGDAAAEPTPASPPRIDIDDFARVDLRVAEVVAAEAVPKSKKLLKLTVSLGDEQPHRAGRDRRALRAGRSGRARRSWWSRTSSPRS